MSEGILFSTVLEGLICASCISELKNYRPFSLLSMVSRIFKKLLSNKLAYHLDNVAFFLIFSNFQVLLFNCRSSDS